MKHPESVYINLGYRAEKAKAVKATDVIRVTNEIAKRLIDEVDEFDRMEAERLIERGRAEARQGY